MMSCVGTVLFIWCVIGIEFDEGQLLGEMNVSGAVHARTHMARFLLGEGEQ